MTSPGNAVTAGNHDRRRPSRQFSGMSRLARSLLSSGAHPEPGALMKRDVSLPLSIVADGGSPLGHPSVHARRAVSSAAGLSSLAPCPIG